MSAFFITSIFYLSGILIFFFSLAKGKRPPKKELNSNFSVSHIIVVHNEQKVILEKLKNSLEINYPSDSKEIIFFSDGSTDATVDIIKEFEKSDVRLFLSEEHVGKYMGMNKSVQAAKGDILIFSDANSHLDRNAITNLVAYFSDPEIGGVCGKLIIQKGDGIIDIPQRNYFKFDEKIKILESSIGSVSANTGKLYAMRRELFQEIPPGVADDLYNCLSVCLAHKRFVYDPTAKVFIKAPSRTISHEIERRRRIVAISLRGIFLRKNLLNPLKYGLFSVNLLINKVLRRFLPIGLVTLFVSNLFLCFSSYWFFFPFGGQILFYAAGVLDIPLARLSVNGIVKQITSTIFYFCIGNYGAFLGLMDFFKGKADEKWEPFRG